MGGGDQLTSSRGGVGARADRPSSAAPTPDDRRSLLVVLTPAGLAAVDAAVTDHVANGERLLGVLTAAERAALDSALRKLLGQFS